MKVGCLLSLGGSNAQCLGRPAPGYATHATRGAPSAATVAPPGQPAEASMIVISCGLDRAARRLVYELHSPPAASGIAAVLTAGLEECVGNWPTEQTRAAFMSSTKTLPPSMTTCCSQASACLAAAASRPW